MSSSTVVPAPPPTAAIPATRRRFLAELDGAPVLGFVAPNWFASVMGTGIVALALAGLPFRVPGAEQVATLVWALAAALLVAVSAATLAHHLHHPDVARGHRRDPVLAHFYGAPAMALMTVGAGAMTVGHHLIGTTPALVTHTVLWTAGTVLGLVTAVAVPYAAITRATDAHEQTAAFGGWLMPVVPPLVSATTGALLVPHLPAGQAQATLLAACYALFGLALIASLVIVTMVWSRLLHHGVGPVATVPTVWIVLGPLATSITAAHHLGRLAPDVLPAPYGEGFAQLTLLLGLPMWGFALLWCGLATLLTRYAARRGMAFSLGWWSLVFPLGNLVAGTEGLAETTGLLALDGAAAVLLIVLLAVWGLVLVRTARGAYCGSLLRAPHAPAPA